MVGTVDRGKEGYRKMIQKKETEKDTEKKEKKKKKGTGGVQRRGRKEAVAKAEIRE